MIEAESAPKPPRFHAERPTDLRRSRPWHHLSHIIAELPAGLERLAREATPPPGGRVLDYGSAEAPYRRFFGSDVDFVTADLPGNPDADIEIGPDGTVALEDASVDVVLSTQVLEHVERPAAYLTECFRVLRPGGRMLLSTHGLMVYHPDPDDYWRWTCAGLRRAVGEAGFAVVRFEGIMGLAATGVHFVQEAFLYRLPRPARPVFALIMQSLVKLADRIDGHRNRELNAMVFVLVAEKP